MMARDIARMRTAPIHGQHAVRLALDNEIEQQLLASLRHWNGTATTKQQATLENVIGRLVRTPLRIRF
jgi:hypothetical protein